MNYVAPMIIAGFFAPIVGAVGNATKATGTALYTTAYGYLRQNNNQESPLPLYHTDQNLSQRRGHLHQGA
jgi:multisubunit Na+/H+ antiporter MnhB subunit